jgi:serine/threonine protein kinase/tetratricopeptide (TPR) repeat protein
MNSNREESLFAMALEKPASERGAFLKIVCGNDESLRQRLEALLAAHDNPERSPPSGALVKATIKLELTGAEDEAVGKTIGRYKILEKVGEGGCGVVYVAEQTEPVRRRVALKVIKLGMDTKQVVARFEAERQALAMMDHPNIAKVLDAGATETGRPFFVMELVRGIRITDYCDQNNLSTKERLELFIKVCQAIQHAHQKGIIHRDIKPSNILVTLHDGVPVPKVIDFGIAKATEGRLTDATVYTQLHQFIGTPAYMSPEQAEMSGLDIDTRSDIYSLGVLLYELLTGRTPFDSDELMSLGLDEMRKAIREKDPVRPSTRFATLEGEELTTTAKRRSTEISKLVHQLKGDLDWIVMKALEKDRTRRYETANGLAADLKRHLSNETVVARPPSSAYRFQKLVRRNKLAFGAGIAIAAALLLGIIASTWQAIRATHAKQEALAAQAQAVEAQANETKLREQADAARSQAEGLAAFMIQDLQPALKDYGRLSLLKQVDEKTVEYFAALPANLRNAKTELAQADAINALGGILAAAGDMKSAGEKGREALALYQSLAKRHPEIPEATAGALNLEWILYSHGPAHSIAEVDTYQQDILRRWHELVAKFPDINFLPLGMGQALGDRGTFATFQLNKPQEAIAAQMEIQDELRKLIALHPEEKGLPAFYAEGLANLSTAYTALGDQDKAVQVSEEAEAFFDKALKEDPGNLTLLSQAASAAQNLSYRIAYASPKRSRDAELVARERYRTLTALDPSNADWRHGFVMTHMMECYYLEGTADIEATRQALKKFDSLLQDLAQSTKLSDGDADKLMQNSMDLARLAASSGDKADARAQLATGETRFQARYEKLPAGSLDRILARVRWLHLKSEVILTLEDWAELERLARESLTVIGDGLEQRPGDSELRLRRAVAQTYLGTALVGMDNAQEAVAPLEEAMTGFRDTPPAITFAESRESYAGNAAFNLAEALVKTGDLARAKNLTESNIARVESGLAKQPENQEGKADMAYCLVQLAGELDPAKPEEAARRQSALDRASAYFNSPEVLAKGFADDKEILAKIAALRDAAKTKTDTKQP